MAGQGSAGGSLGLAGLIDQHGECIYADLHRYHGGLNLFDLIGEDSGYTPREILILIKKLPLSSATKAAMRGGTDYEGWDLSQYQTANLIDVVRENTYATLKAAGAKKVKPPEPSYRPGQEEVEKKKKSNNLFAKIAAQRLANAKKARRQQDG